MGSYSQKWAAERAAERVQGVRAVKSDIEVRLEAQDERSDADLAKAAVRALQRNLLAAADHVKVEVEDGWITLRGEVEFEYERWEAERSLRDLPGVKGIINLIAVRPSVRPDDLKEEIEAAFKRLAALDATGIQIEMSGGEVVLRGTVRTWAEREEAERVAWSAPGVTAVRNEIQVKAVA